MHAETQYRTKNGGYNLDNRNAHWEKHTWLQSTRLFRYANGGRRCTGVAGEPQALWDELISTCLAEQVAIDRTELETWLADNGWQQDAVTSIADRFFADSEWLAKRLAVTSQ